MNRRNDHPRGQVVIITAAGMIVFILAVGLVIDTGIGFMTRRDAQNIADLSAMAGTKVVADNYVDGGRSGTQVYNAVDGASQLNGCAADCTWTATYVAPAAAAGGTEQDLGSVTSGGTIPGAAQGVRVNVQRSPSTFFMRVAGLNTVDVATAATALTAKSTQAPPGILLPIAMSPPDDLEYGTVYDITDGMNGPGNFGWLSWDGSNDANGLAASVCNPDNPEITVPFNIPGNPGKKNRADMRQCLQDYIDNGTTVLIPIWDGVDPGNGNGATYRIIGFAAFKLTYRSQPAIDNLRGVFQEFYPLATVPAGFGTQPTAGDPSYYLGLIR